MSEERLGTQQRNVFARRVIASTRMLAGDVETFLLKSQHERSFFNFNLIFNTNWSLFICRLGYNIICISYS